jgi:hypothetical protein
VLSSVRQVRDMTFHTQTRGKVFEHKGNVFRITGFLDFVHHPEFRTMDKVQKRSNCECYTPLSESFKGNVLHTHLRVKRLSVQEGNMLRAFEKRDCSGDKHWCEDEYFRNNVL